MEKYSVIKTIGDGTYGSVVKAMTHKTGMLTSIFYNIYPLSFLVQYLNDFYS